MILLSKRMMFSLLLHLLAGFTMAQTPMEAFKETKTIVQAEKLAKKYPKAEATLFSISSDKDTTDITLPLFDKSAGYTFTIDNYSFKILETISIPQFRVSYIYLDGSQLKLQEIDSLRNLIISKYKSGTLFYELVGQYTMDGNPSGDLNWFGEGDMVKDFELAIKHHTKGEIFTVDVPENKWYYVTLKTFDDRIIKKTTLLKIKKGPY